MTVVEVLIVVAVVILLGVLLVPWVSHLRDQARKQTCADRMGAIVKAMHGYHDQNDRLPAAGTWDTSVFRSLALHENRRWDLFIRENWAIELLPYLGQAEIYDLYDSEVPIGDAANAVLRESAVLEYTCPVDTWNTSENPYAYQPTDEKLVTFARGNFAINGGTNSFHTHAGSTSTPTGDHAHLEMNLEIQEFSLWGNGISGFNKSFRLDDFQNGQSTLAAVNEIRAGIDPIDIRGSWALGHIAASVTWGHGVNGDDYGPNNPWARSDDIQDCGLLNEKHGPEKLIELGMPCVSYVDKNQNATSRSLHEGGVNAAFLDGSVRFVSNAVDPSLWHVMHSRETPAGVFAPENHALASWTGSDEEADAPAASVKPDELEPKVINSLGMEFALIPAGEFTMGVPDKGNDIDTPPETPAHQVRLSSPYYLGVTEVTREQYEQVMGDVPQTAQEDLSPAAPVINVTWQQANEFCERLSLLSDETQEGRHYRLPTEAEWEYASREGQSRAHPWRSVSSSENATGDSAGLKPSLPLTDVASYQPNAFGLYDMRGNAWEWTADWFDRDYYGRSRVDDPAGPKEGYLKVVRGSDWIYCGEGCFINYPILAPWKSSPFIGFRVVCVLKETKNTERERHASD
jgi:prepilin-type processing-associated H-X9-DG protein